MEHSVGTRRDRVRPMEVRMHVLIVYGTVEGQTRKIARHIGNMIQDKGHVGTVFDQVDLDDVDLGQYDAVIVAAPLHMGRFPAGIDDWVTTHAAALNGIPGAFVSVSLGAASPFEEERADVARIRREFCERSGWRPVATHDAAGALRYTRYDFLKRLLMKYISAGEGGSIDVSRDHEMTDWKALGDFVSGFVRQAEVRA